MSKEITRDLIIDFLLEEDLEENYIDIANQIIIDEDLQAIYEEEKYFCDIERYINKEMSVYESLDYKIKYQKNEELKRDIRLSKSIDTILFVESVSKQYFAELEEEKTTKSRKPEEQTTLFTLKNKLLRWAAAAILLINVSALTITAISSKRNAIENKLFAEYYEYNVDEELAALGNNKFNNTPFEGNSLVPGSFEINTLKGQKQLLLAGKTLLAQKKYKEATGILFELYHNANIHDAYLKTVSGWYLGLCYLKEKRIREATVVLKYVEDCNMFKSKEAKEILERLEKKLSFELFLALNTTNTGKKHIICYLLKTFFLPNITFFFLPI